jgi:methionine synthase II (cobalamin-independent)
MVKGQITGPISWGLCVTDREQKGILYDELLAEALAKFLRLKAMWQERFLRRISPDTLIFFDEPYLACFGSAYTAINRQDVVKGLNELTGAVKSKDVLLGIHCCGNTDWSIFTDITSIDIISFDAFGFLDKLVLYGNNLRGFLERGGILCWGIVPTGDFSGRQTEDLLLEKINGGINALVKKGLDKDLIFKNLIVSPSCGMGTLDVDRAEKILHLLSEISKKIKK